jgi:hypothetical protein
MTAVELIGPYHGDSFGGDGTHTAAIGWDGLYIGACYPDRIAGIRIDRDDVPIGWTSRSSVIRAH